VNKTGVFGALGNKGNLMLRFNYFDTSFCCACCHLAAGFSSINGRLSEIQDILNKAFSNEMKFKDHDIQYIFGDLNFRIDMDNELCRKMIKNKSLSTLVDHDQLNKAKSTNTVLFDLNEGPLIFNPTYKYITGTDEYDNKKKRIPSW